jgi:hypothetical protein
MTVNDVERVLQPNANLIHVSSVTPEEKRLTFQHFDTNDPVVMIVAPHNCDAHVPDDADWPPDLIFDAAYGVAVVKAWGTPAFKEFSRNSTKAIYNEDNNGVENVGDDDTNGGTVTMVRGSQRMSVLKGPRTGQRGEMVLTFTICSWGYGCSMLRSVKPMP